MTAHVRKFTPNWNHLSLIFIFLSVSLYSPATCGPRSRAWVLNYIAPKIFVGREQPALDWWSWFTKSFYKSLLCWEEFHDFLPTGHQSKLPTFMKGIVLRGCLYGRGPDKTQKLSTETVAILDGALEIAKEVRKINALRYIWEAFRKYQTITYCTIGKHESSRFNAAVSC